MREGGGWSPKSLAHTITRDVRHVTQTGPRASSAPQPGTERRECHRARLNTTEHPARPRLARRYYGRDRTAKVVVGKGG